VVVAGVDWPVTLIGAADRAVAALEAMDPAHRADDAGIGADGTSTAAADAAAEAALLGFLAEEAPAAVLCSEEAGIVAGSTGGPGSGALLIVDPVDGTNNVLAGIPYWAVSIAVVIDGVGAGGLVRNGATGEDVFGWVGRGVRRGGRPVTTSAVTRLSRAAVALQRPADPLALARCRRLLAAAKLPRMLGAAALDLALVATGALDGYANVNTDTSVPFGERVVDYAAGAVLVEAAGGVATDASGAALPLEPDLGRHSPVVAAGTRALHADLMARLHSEDGR